MIARPYRLREESDVRRVRSRGKAFAHGALVARMLPNNEDPPINRYTVVAGKKCGNAVDRNRLKRLTREALRGFHPFLKPGHDIVFVVRGNVTEMPTLTEAQVALTRIFAKAGLVQQGDEPGQAPPAPGEPVTSGWRAPARAEGSHP
jgi:ribonuclease P protein component